MSTWSQLSLGNKIMTVVAGVSTAGLALYASFWHFSSEPTIVKVASCSVLGGIVALVAYLIFRRKG